MYRKNLWYKPTDNNDRLLDHRQYIEVWESAVVFVDIMAPSKTASAKLTLTNLHVKSSSNIKSCHAIIYRYQFCTDNLLNLLKWQFFH